MLEIHERIKNRRVECGLSVEEVAQSLGVSRATIYRYESSEIKNMGVDKLEPLAAVLNTTPKYLMGWTDDPTDYDNDDLIAEVDKPNLEHFESDVKRALAFKKAVDGDIENEERPSYYLDPEVAEMANELHKNPEMRILFDASKKLTKDDLRFVTEMVNRIRKEENKD
ncbi:MAG: helix-turn-helix transcriptional regulator [Anaeromusa sp.]|jgi:transcriptional regulator with XRE-family HTH domain|uniref:helix-turn-helix domain-containing protein n=1 Tax=Anaeromusa sp. TaxID=1872520 RepID=UPI002B215CFA|nr:helix-turn-helix transcriptional regulator [Anaeromusa sp.]MEA4835155.1 helix-turn-helix transcriptional regulator [Anaeromusa sp.]